MKTLFDNVAEGLESGKGIGVQVVVIPGLGSVMDLVNPDFVGVDVVGCQLTFFNHGIHAVTGISMLHPSDVEEFDPRIGVGLAVMRAMRQIPEGVLSAEERFNLFTDVVEGSVDIYPAPVGE